MAKLDSKAVFVAGVVNGVAFNVALIIPHLMQSTMFNILMYVLLDLLMLGSLVVLVVGAQRHISNVINSTVEDSHSGCAFARVQWNKDVINRVKTTTLWYSALIGSAGAFSVRLSYGIGGIAYMLNVAIIAAIVIVGCQAIMWNANRFREQEKMSME